ncbi:hypothetical protein BC937DRAFT_95393 [Endogone sp. FLAS-F59071]|nr:hypothetical protein BC937DRAFT_95393 [Endogone sp. FLAS-F59071]|eukprot:RUS20360.1 hypothetical protein BC937DRAFT_95393 [Endogone sp. FLAS-F59071]
MQNAKAVIELEHIPTSRIGQLRIRTGIHEISDDAVLVIAVSGGHYECVTTQLVDGLCVKWYVSIYQELYRSQRIGGKADEVEQCRLAVVIDS